MNSQLQKMKDAIKAYQKKAQEAQQKIERARQLYQEKPAQEEAQRIRAGLEKDRQVAIDAIRAAKNEGVAAVKGWATKDGSKLTDDVNLLKNGLINPKEFAGMVEKYSDNYTMLEMLRTYGETMNAEKAKDAHGIPADAFPVGMIPTADGKLSRWDNIENSAVFMLDSLSGNGDPRDLRNSPYMQDIAVENWGNNVEI